MITPNFTLLVEVALFLIFLGASYRFVWRPLLETMDARSSKIEQDKLSAEECKKEAQRLDALYRQQLTEVHQKRRTD